MSETFSPQPAPLVTAVPPRVLVLLCTYNEADNLPALFQQLARALPQADVLVVDDNSPDGTASIVQSQIGFRALVRNSVQNLESVQSDAEQLAAIPPAYDPITPQESKAAIYLLSRDGKQGLGTATRTGLQWCLQRPYDFIINLDADLSHDPAMAPLLLAACRDANRAWDVAVGSRYVAGGSMPGLATHRRWISRALNGYATRLLGLPVKDCSGSFRCYRTTALRKLDFKRLVCPGYGFLEEILVALHRSGAQLTEVPIEFRSRSQGHSKLGLSDAWGALAVIHRLAWTPN